MIEASSSLINGGIHKKGSNGSGRTINGHGYRGFWIG